MRTVSFQTQGCRLNQAETEMLQRSFQNYGYKIVNEGEPADVCVVNTCTVTEKADAKNRQVIRSLQRKNPHTKIAVVGCHAQISPEELAGLKGVRIVLGNEEKMRLPEHLATSLQTGTTKIVKPRINRNVFQVPIHPENSSTEKLISESGFRKGFRTRASLKIQDGCDFMCSFCIIPRARGRSRHREYFNLLEEAVLLSREGVKEIVITGVNIGTYFESGKTILDVIDALNKLDELVRIRISSIEPTTVPEGLLDRMADQEHKLVPFLHLPLQSGSDPILTAMNRRYRVGDYALEVLNAWKRVPGICIGTDVMTGFPGESEIHFQETRELLSHLPLTYFHVFPFSARTKTPANRMDNQLPSFEIRRRSRELRKMSDHKRKKMQENLIGTVQEVLIESRKPDGSQSGYTPSYTRVTLEGKEIEDLRNSILPLQINSIQGSKVFGSL